MINKTQEEVTAKWKSLDTEHPLASIKCLAFNHEKYIVQAMDGFLMQETDFPFEVIVHDDASTDKTADILREYEKKFPLIVKPIYETENQYKKRDGSLTRAANAPLKGKYIALCEGDDYWTVPNKLQQQIDYLEGHPDCAVVVHRCSKYNDQTGKYEGTFPKFTEERDITTEEVILGGGGLFGTNTMVFRREILEYHKQAFWDASPVGDFPAILSCAHFGKVHFIPEIMSVYRIFCPGSWSSKTLLSKDAFNKRLVHINACEESLLHYDEFTEKKYTQAIQEKLDLNKFNLYWDFGKWSLLKTTMHYNERSLLGKLKALYQCIKA